MPYQLASITQLIVFHRVGIGSRRKGSYGDRFFIILARMERHGATLKTTQ